MFIFVYTLMARSKRSKLSKPELPESMILNILCWLPGMSLLRFKSVCKSWLSIIEDPEFMKSRVYYSQIMANKKASLLMITRDEAYIDRPRFVSIDSKYYLHKPHYFKFKVVGSCNGIICLADDGFYCQLWNPSIKQSKLLPEYPKIKQKVLKSYHQVELAFGFDSLANDYKVVRFVCPKIRKTSPLVPVVQLYSTNTDSWKEIEVCDKSISGVLCQPHLKLGPVINGLLYIGHMGQLVSFDLHNEVFAAVRFPGSKLIKSDVLDFEGSVAVIFQSKRKRSGISLWTLADIGGKLFWTKKFNFVHDDIHHVYSYLGGGLHYAENKSNINIVYDYINNDVKPFPRLAKEPEAVFKFTETLASVEGFKPSVSFISKFYPQV